MKISVVPFSRIAASRGLNLGAHTYLCATMHVDRAIARAERTIALAQARLKTLKAERARILQNEVGA